MPSRVAPRRKLPPAARLRAIHSTLGLTLLIGMLFFSATGLTWSQWAGNNIGVWRNALGWQTPSLNTALVPHSATVVQDAHAEHHGEAMAHHAAPPAGLDNVDNVLG